MRFPQHKRATIRGAARRLWPAAHGLDILAAAAAATDDSSGNHTEEEEEDEEGEDRLGNHNLEEYRAAWQRGETDTVRHFGSAAAAEEEVRTSSAIGPAAAMGAASARSTAAGDLVVQVRDLLSLQPISSLT